MVIMKEIDTLSWPEDVDRDMQTLGSLIRKYRFKEAREVLWAVMEKIREASEWEVRRKFS